ncbi:MAG: hypothetical protein MZU84_04670 [Sphingobacterium sp.]|nr:hypothetical protein [Sphingobacterium sp.]
MTRMVVVFPAPFGPEEAEDLAPLDAERDVVHGGDPAVALREVLDLDHSVLRECVDGKRIDRTRREPGGRRNRHLDARVGRPAGDVSDVRRAVLVAPVLDAYSRAERGCQYCYDGRDWGRGPGASADAAIAAPACLPCGDSRIGLAPSPESLAPEHAQPAPACPVCEIHAESVFRVEGMDCHEEVAILERRLKPAAGPRGDERRRGRRHACACRYDAAQLSAAAIAEAVNATGMRAWLDHEAPRPASPSGRRAPARRSSRHRGAAVAAGMRAGLARRPAGRGGARCLPCPSRPGGCVLGAARLVGRAPVRPRHQHR